MGFSKPSKVQAQTLPMILTGPPFRNLVAQAHNGSGKTTCFVLGMLSRCDPSVAKPQALCVCPTRELVVQNVEVLRKMATHTRISCAAALKEPQGRPAASSRMEPVADQVVIGTPGTVNGWIVRKTLSLRCAPLPPPSSALCSALRRADCQMMDKHFPTGADVTLMSTMFNHHLSTDGSPQTHSTPSHPSHIPSQLTHCVSSAP